MSLANALMSPFFWSISTRNSRAEPTGFLAADNNASCTAPTRTSRLMLFLRSQNSKTAKKSAFIRSTRRSRSGNKKVGDGHLPTLARWLNQQTLPFLGDSLRGRLEPVKRKQIAPIQGEMESWRRKLHVNRTC